MRQRQQCARFFLCALSCAITAITFAADDGAGPTGVVGDAGGTGSWPAVAQARGDLPQHTLYRPVPMPDMPLPVLLWGNGGCSANGLAHAGFLRQIASHGYIVVALGSPRASRPSPAAAATAPDGPATDATEAAQLIEALEWATTVNGTADDALSGRFDLDHIAVAGHSCGGLQALKVSPDPRIDTSMIFNSGVYNRPGGRSSVAIDKAALADLHGPVAYFTGGADDIAHANTVDDVSRITHVPVFFGWKPVGHGGTFAEPDGGAWAEVAVHWLDWQLKGDGAAAGWFTGDACLLCQAEGWTVERAIAP